MAEELVTRSTVELAHGIRSGEFTSSDVVEAFLDRIEERNDVVNGFVTVMADSAREAAREADRALESGTDLGPLHGVPIAIKDSMAVAGVPMTYGTTLLKDNVPEQDAETVKRLREAGAIVLGKTTLPEFGLYNGTYNKLTGATCNPFDLDKTVGGSSGGSGAVVADGQVPLAQGSDGGGSLRMPASACGVYTIKPTFGVVANYTPGRDNAFGGAPLVGIGPMARNVEDAALMFDVIAGPHPRDPFSVPRDDSTFLEATKRSISQLKIAYSPALDLYPIDQRVRDVVDDAVTAFRTANATVEEVSIDCEYERKEITNSFMLKSAVATAAMGESLKEEYGIEIPGKDEEAILDYLVQQFSQGYEYDGIEYARADEIQTAVYDAIEDVFADYDLLACATLLVPPIDNSVYETAPGPSEVDGVRLDDYRWGTLIDWRTTQIFNMTGHPAASIPAGFTDENLPVGLHLVGARFADDTVIAASAAYERIRPWQDSYPFRSD